MTSGTRIFIKRYWILLVLFIGIPIILLFGYFYIKTSFKLLDNLDRKNKEYSMVKTENEIFGVVDSVYSSHGGAFVTLNDSTKIWFEVTENRIYDKYLLCDFLQPNDFLFKKLDNDTLFVFRNHGSYFFKIGQLNNSGKGQKLK
jgi:hypothetical protein